MRQLTDSLSSNKREVAGQHLANVSMKDIFANPAFMGIFRKFMSKTAEDEAENRDAYLMSLRMFEFWMDVQDFKAEPESVRTPPQHFMWLWPAPCPLNVTHHPIAASHLKPFASPVLNPFGISVIHQ